jgi:hypothetical protein
LPFPTDIYGGLIGLPCTNTNTAFGIAQVGQRKVFCTPAGHGFFSRGFYVMDPNLGAQLDESGGTYQGYVTTKYGSVANALTAAASNILAWGMNTIAPFGNVNLKSPANPVNKIPFVELAFTSEYVLDNRAGWGTGSAKDFFYYLGGSGAATTWTGFHNSTGMADIRDPNWVGMMNGIMNNDSGFVALGSTTTANKNYLLGFSMDESDGTHCFGAGPDFTTQPPGNNDFRCGYVPFFLPPVAYANSHQGEIYPDGTMYMKKRMHDLLVAKYGTFGALNTAWGSSYTTFDSSGTCVGSQPITCASSVGADSVGTGTGVALSFSSTLSHTQVSIYSLGIFVAGVLVAGDTGAGALFGTNVTGTINYTTGALTVTFASGDAPANGAAITAGYVANGFGIGTGFMDEDCRAGHSAYCGNGSNNTTIFLTGIPAAVQTDINAMTQDWANYYSSTTKATTNAWASAHGFTGSVLNLGPSTLGTWTTPPDRYVLMGMCGTTDVISSGGQGAFSQAETDFVDTYCPGLPQITGTYRTANADSPFSWPNSACTHSGTTVTCTLATPFKFTTSDLIDVTCNNSDYNFVQGHPSVVGASTLSYVVGASPVEASATCNVFYDDANVGGYPSQAARAAAFQSTITASATTKYTSSNIFPFVGYYWWQYNDNEAEKLNWGPVTYRDNPYNGLDDVTAVVGCQAPGSAFNCGGELRQNRGGSIIPAIIATNLAIDTALLSGPVTPPGVGPVGIF